MPSMITPFEYLILVGGMVAAIAVGIGAFFYSLFRRK